MPFEHNYTEREMEDCRDFLMTNQDILEYIDDKDECYEHGDWAWSEFVTQATYDFHTYMPEWMGLCETACMGHVLKYFAVHEPESLQCFKNMQPDEILEWCLKQYCYGLINEVQRQYHEASVKVQRALRAKREHEASITIQKYMRGHDARWRNPCFTFWKSA